jgi:hypothetical protein
MADVSTSPPSDQVATLARINGRLEAEALLALRMIGAGPEYQQAFARTLREYADSVLGAPETDLRVMDENQASSFELNRIPFGRHHDLPYSLVPIEYLTWVADQGNNLAAYLRSDRGQRRLREAGQ